MENPILFIIPGACSLGSMIALEWSGIPYQIGITTPEIRASESFRQINPTGRVAALKDQDLLIGENLAILLYLADKHPSNPMCPTSGTTERIKVYQWLSYLSSTLHPAFGQVLYSSRFISEPHIDEFKSLAVNRLREVLKYINDRILETGLFIGENPTIVDGQAYGILRWANGAKIKEVINLNGFPKITNFFNLMEKEIAVKNALAIEKEQLNNLENSQFIGYYKFSQQI